MSVLEPAVQDPLAALPGYTLRRAANAMMADLAGRLTPHKLRIADASVLLLIGERQDRTSSEIGRRLDIQRANMVPLLARLEQAGLIARQPIDRKSQAVVLTSAGLAKLAKVQQLTEEFERDLLGRVPEVHRPHLMPALNSLWQ